MRLILRAWAMASGEMDMCVIGTEKEGVSRWGV